MPHWKAKQRTIFIPTTCASLSPQRQHTCQVWSRPDERVTRKVQKTDRHSCISEWDTEDTLVSLCDSISQTRRISDADFVITNRTCSPQVYQGDSFLCVNNCMLASLLYFHTRNQNVQKSSLTKMAAMISFSSVLVTLLTEIQDTDCDPRKPCIPAKGLQANSPGSSSKHRAGCATRMLILVIVRKRQS